MSDEGVPLSKLRCPTCRSLFGLKLLYTDEHEDPFTYGPARASIDGHDLGPVRISLHSIPFLRCEAGHEWSLKLLVKSPDSEDAVLLHRYLGGGELEGRPSRRT